MIPRTWQKRHPQSAPGAPIFLNGRVVGHVRDGVFEKTLARSRHFLRRPPAIAFDRSTLQDARRAGATRVRIYEREQGDVYEADLDEVELHGFPVQRGFGDQVALHLSRWTVNGQPPRTARTNAERKALQLGLFGEEEVGR